MPIIEISSLSHPGVEIFSALTEAQLRYHIELDKGLFIVESPKVIKRALEAGYEPLAILCEHKHIIGDASDVGAALSKLQAHPMLRNALLFPQLCDAVPHKRFIAAVVVHDPLPPISAYYFNIRECCGFVLKSSTFASHNE